MSCNKGKVMSVLCKDIPRYGPKLGVKTAKPFQVLANDFQRWRRNEQSFDGRQANIAEESSSNVREENIEERVKNQKMAMLEVEEESSNKQAAVQKRDSHFFAGS